jgi:hypothetical protein
MGKIADEYEKLQVFMQSPDRHISGSLQGRRKVELRFRGSDSFSEYDDEAELASQLEHVLNGLIAQQREAKLSIVRTVAGLRTASGQHWDAAQRRYQDERARLNATGLSIDEYVTISCTGMREMDVTIVRGTLDQLEGSEFLLEVNSALSEMWVEWGIKSLDLQQRTFGLTRTRHLVA